jgi:hypothetical protein
MGRPALFRGPDEGDIMFHSTQIQAETPVALDATEPEALQAQAPPPPRRLRMFWIGVGGSALAASLALSWFAARPACSCALPPINLKSFLDPQQTHVLATRPALTGSTLGYKNGADPHSVLRPGASLTREPAPAVTRASATLASAVSR